MSVCEVRLYIVMLVLLWSGALLNTVTVKNETLVKGIRFYGQHLIQSLFCLLSTHSSMFLLNFTCSSWFWLSTASSAYRKSVYSCRRRLRKEARAADPPF